MRNIYLKKPFFNEYKGKRTMNNINNKSLEKYSKNYTKSNKTTRKFIK